MGPASQKPGSFPFLLKPACVRSAITAAHEKLALNLYRRDVSLEQARRADRLRTSLRTSKPIS
jgi:hypothetical protein